MSALASQFEFTDEIQIVPLGEFSHPSGKVQVVDHPAINTMIAEFNHKANRQNFPGLLVDFDHFSYDASKPSEAAGWIVGLVKKPDGLWANVRWTTAGEEAARSGRYRLVSPVFSRVEQLQGNRVRPIELDTVALTNAPNITETYPISNRLLLNRRHQERAASAPPKTGEPLTIQSLSNSARVLAEAHAKKFGKRFHESWEYVLNRYKVLHTLMYTPEPNLALLLNREGRPAIGPSRTHNDADTQERFWSAVEASADSVRDEFVSQHTWDGSPGNRAKWMGAAGYSVALQALEKKYGRPVLSGKGNPTGEYRAAGYVDSDFLWEEMRKQFPREWADFVLHHAHHQGLV